MDRLERTALLLSGLLVSVFFAALVWSARGLGIAVPTCVTDVKPFLHGAVIDKGDNHWEVHVVARMWAFDPAEIRLPRGADVDLYLSALDVTHGFYVERTNVNLMAVPGIVNAAHVRFDREGDYPIICDEYCGVAHQNMAGRFVVAGDRVAAPPPAPPTGDPVTVGARLFAEKACVGCHSIDGRPMTGPTLKGLIGRAQKLADKRTITVDEAFVEHYLRHPNDPQLDGFPPVMPQLPLGDDEIRALVAYLKTL